MPSFKRQSAPAVEVGVLAWPDSVRTLDGRYCSKKKCKVFEQIICANN